MKNRRIGPLALLLLAHVSALAASHGSIASARKPGQLVLKPCAIAGAECGTYTVYENRRTRQGRTIDLYLVVLRATGSERAPDPVFILAGGPGQAATAFAERLATSPVRRQRDIVLVDQRGTGRSNPLFCRDQTAPTHPAVDLQPLFAEQAYRDCLATLRQRADLRQYSTPIAMDDLDEVRRALGYGQINLIGGSYGTRAALVYLRQYPRRVRTAVLNGVAPFALKNPLYHAAGAQEALDRVFALCAADSGCTAAFPNLAGKFERLQQRLRQAPAVASYDDNETKRQYQLQLTYDAFAEALRVMLYGSNSIRTIPLALNEAFNGDFTVFTRLAVAYNRALRRQLADGMLLSVVCAEDVARISDQEIDSLTADTFLGDTRVRAQKRVCDFWPQGELPPNYSDAIISSVPVLMISGTLDPVTPPRWAEALGQQLRNSRHLVLPAGHHPGGECIESVIAAFIARGSYFELDISCTQAIDYPPFELPPQPSSN